jgi:activator of HSP90 ATPase
MHDPFRATIPRWFLYALGRLFRLKVGDEYGHSRLRLDQQAQMEEPMKTKTIRQSVTFNAVPHDLYEILMDSRKHSRLAGGGKTKISRAEGGAFSVYDGYATGFNLMLVPDTLVVQSWRASDWPEGHFSKATFSFKEVKGGTRLTFRQSGVPEDQHEAISQGWRDYYWGPMKEMVTKKA